MMQDPKLYIEDLKNEPLEKLRKVRDKLIREVKYFENHRAEIMSSEEALISPSPDTIYHWNLQALGYLFELIADKIQEQEDEI